MPRRGLEPPQCYPPEPESGASTNSAIWAQYRLRILLLWPAVGVSAYASAPPSGHLSCLRLGFMAHSHAQAIRLSPISCQSFLNPIDIHPHPVQLANAHRHTKRGQKVGESPSGKAAGFGPAIRGFESFLPSHGFLLKIPRVPPGILGIFSKNWVELKPFELRPTWRRSKNIPGGACLKGRRP